MQNDNGNLDRILKEIKQKGSKKEAEDYLMKQLSPTQSEKLQAVLQDENAMQNLLKTGAFEQTFGGQRWTAFVNCLIP